MSQPPDKESGVDRTVELRAMANMLRRADGFTLAFAQCNQPVERRRLVSELRQTLDDYPIADIEFTDPIEHLLDELIPLLPEHKDARALFIYGLEHSIRSDREFSPMVANLNMSRNLFPRHISCPVVIWLPVYAITAVMRGAPDFFSWRSGLFQFPSPSGVLTQVSQNALSGDVLAIINLTLEEKKGRIAVIEDLLADYESLPTDKRDRRTEGSLFYRLANLYYSLGDYDQAREYCQQSLKISEELGDKSGIAYSLSWLGNIAYAHGDYDQAEEYCQQSLKIFKELGDIRGIAYSLYQLGMIAHIRGDYDQAAEYCQQSLKIFKELRDKSGIAYSLYQLGIIADARGDHDQAREYYQQSLKIFKELGDKSGIAGSLHQFGNIAYIRGDYDQAAEYCQQSLKIEGDLGSKSGIAGSLYQLGMIAHIRGNYDQAGEYYQQSLTIFKELRGKSGIAVSLAQLGLLYDRRGDTHIAIRLMAAAHEILAQIGSYHREPVLGCLMRLQATVEQDDFETLTKEAQADPEKVVREILDSHHSE